MCSLLSSCPRRSFLESRRSSRSSFGSWLSWWDVLGPPPSTWAHSLSEQKVLSSESLQVSTFPTLESYQEEVVFPRSSQTMASHDSGYLSPESHWAKGPLVRIATSLYTPDLRILPRESCLSQLKPNDGEPRFRVPKPRVSLSKRSSGLNRYWSLHSQGEVSSSSFRVPKLRALLRIGFCIWTT